MGRSGRRKASYNLKITRDTVFGEGTSVLGLSKMESFTVLVQKGQSLARQKGHIADQPITVSLPDRIEKKDLSGLNLSGQTFDGTSIYSVRIGRLDGQIASDLSQTVFVGSRIKKTRFEGVDLREAVFLGVDIRDSAFVDLAFPDGLFSFNGPGQASVIQNSKFENVDFQGLSIIPKNRFLANQFYQCQFSEGFEFDALVFDGSQFEKMIFEDNSWLDSGLIGTQFRDCPMKSPSFHRSNLSRSTWTTGSEEPVAVTDWKFHRSNWNDARIENIHFFDGDVAYSEIKNARFNLCHFDQLAFEDTALSGTVFTDCRFRGVDFSDLDLDDVRFVRCHFSNSLENQFPSSIRAEQFEACSGRVAS